MSGSQLLRLRVNERLEAAVEEIFGLVEKTITQYEEEAVRSKREIGQLKQQLEQLVVLKPEVILNRADTQSFFEEILPDQQQPDRPPDVEENGPWDSGGVKEEPVDRLIGPDAEAEPATEAEAGCPKPERGGGRGGGAGSGSGSGSGSAPPRKQVDQCVVTDFREDLLQVRLPEPAAQTDFQLFPASGTITVTLNEEEDDDYAASSSRSAAQVAGQVCHFYGERFGRDSDLIAHIDQVHTDQIHTDQIHTDQIHTDQIHTDQVHTDRIHTDQVHTDQIHTDQVHTSARAFKCPECNKRFACRAHLVAHLRIHTGEKPYRCSFCARSFAQSSNLNVHLRMHTGEKPYFCRACGKMVARSNHLKTCGKTRLERRRAFRCSPCGKTFRAAAKLRAHERTHEAGTS